MTDSKDTRLVAAAREQFFSCYQMLETLVDICPDEVWFACYGDVPFWYQVYHTIYFVDYWFREDYAAEDFLVMRFDERIPPEFEWEIPANVSLSRAQMQDYLTRIREKLNRIITRQKEGRSSLLLAKTAVGCLAGKIWKRNSSGPLIYMIMRSEK